MRPSLGRLELQSSLPTVLEHPQPMTNEVPEAHGPIAGQLLHRHENYDRDRSLVPTALGAGAPCARTSSR